MTRPRLIASAPSATAPPSTISTAISAAATGTLYLWARFIYVYRTTANLGAVQGGDRFLAFLGIRHLYESEAARTTCVAIGHDAYAIHLSVSSEELAQVIF